MNTIIDDLFAFIVKMPILHRIACFRDDVIFIIYMIQRFIYPVDKTRTQSLNWEDDENDQIEEENNDENDDENNEELNEIKKKEDVSDSHKLKED